MKPAYLLGWQLFRFLFTVYFRWRVYHPERVPPQGPVILAANHASYIDPFLVGAGIHRELHYLTRESAMRYPVMGTILRKWNAVPVDPASGASGLRAIFERLDLGSAVILFPEGTRTPTGRFLPARSGIGLLVIKSSAPVVPVRVFGTFQAYSRHMLFPRPRRLQVKYGHAMQFEALRQEAKTCSKARLKEIYQEAADEIMSAIIALEPGQAPAD